MPDRFGPRGVIAVMIPQQNSNMQPEYEAMRPAGINHQMYRFDISKQDRVPEEMIRALPQAAGCWPDMVVCSNSVEMRHWSVARQIWYREATRAAMPGVPMVWASDACVAALHSVGARKIGFISPMSDAYSQSVQDYYAAHGMETVTATALQVKASAEIIKVPVDAIHAAFEAVNGAGVDTFLHVGGALGIVDMIDDLEARLGKPIVSSNAATYWYALRQMGIDDPLDRGGRLTRMPLAPELRDPTALVV
ncbi:maleate cis-trans isomerase family protein [Gymnodinialimonas sp.]